MVTTLPAPIIAPSPTCTPLIEPLPELRQNGVSGGGYNDVGPEHGVIAHINMRIIHARQVEIRVDVCAEVDVPAAEVGVEGRLNIAARPDLRKHFLQHANFGGGHVHFFISLGRVIL